MPRTRMIEITSHTVQAGEFDPGAPCRPDPSSTADLGLLSQTGMPRNPPGREVPLHCHFPDALGL